MYRFVIGGSGSGKSNRVFTDCISAAMADESSHFLLITPEQSTTWTEKEIVKLHPYHATDNIDVVSFSRLAYRVFEELNINNPQVLNDIEKAMLLRRIGYEQKSALKIWGNRFDKPGFVDNLKSMISELYQYGVGPDDLKADASFGNRLNNKLDDLRLIYTEFKKEIAEKYTTAEEIPDILAKNIHRSQLIKNSTIILDGFTGFTPIQYRIIEEFLCYAKEVVVTVSMGEDSDNPLFDMSREMIRRIKELGDRNSISAGADIRLTTNNFLEHHILRYDGATYVDQSDQVCAVQMDQLDQVYAVQTVPRIIRAQNMQDEAAFICAQIQKLVKKEGKRYREIAVVCSDLASYGPLLDHEMELSGIPSYMDETIGISDNMLAKFITGALDVISSDYSYDSFIRFLKCGLAEDNDDLVFVIDNYMYECGRRGYKRVRADWDYMPADITDIDRESLNAYKNSILDKLENLRETFASKTAPVPAIVEALNELMTTYQVKDKLATMAETFATGLDRPRQREYDKAYESITAILANMADLLSDESMNADEFAEIFTAGVSQVKLGVIPSGTDRVIIGDLTRSRIEGVKILFVAGANEGLLPKLLNRKNVITDSEKERLKAGGLELAPTAKEDLFIQRYYLYRVLSKPTEQLIMTYAGMDGSGATMRPSYMVVHLEKLYPMIKEEEAKAEILDIHSAITAIGEGLRDIRLSGPENASETFRNLYAYLFGKEETRDIIELITSASLYAYKHSKLSKETIDLLYGDNIMGSVSKLEMFAKCPYRYFAQYGLGLKDIQAFAFKAVDIGNISHAALEKLFVQVQKKNLDLRTMDESERDSLVEECISQALLDDESAKYKDSAHNAYMVQRVERVVKRSLWGLLQNLDDNYRPYAMEWTFSPKDHLTSTKLDLDNGKTMELTGKVDRTDIDDTDPLKVAVRVIDYKSGKKSWDLNDVINGNDMQITMYMAAVQELLGKRFNDKKVTPEQMYYYTVQDPIIDKDGLSSKKTVEDELKKEMTLAGIKERERIEELIPYVKNKAEGIGRRIIDGDIEVAPKYMGKDYTSCSSCEYKSVCGYDKKIQGYKCRTDKKYDKDEQWQIISGQTNN